MHHIDDVAKALCDVKGMNVSKVDEFYDYKTVIESHFKELRGIHDAAEICVVVDNPSIVYFNKVGLPATVTPCLELYEHKQDLKKNGAVNDIILKEWNAVQKIEKKALTATKSEHLKNYYLKGLVRKELYEFYGFPNDDLWGTNESLSQL